jgi:hypothetical protein
VLVVATCLLAVGNGSTNCLEKQLYWHFRFQSNFKSVSEVVSFGFKVVRTPFAIVWRSHLLWRGKQPLKAKVKVNNEPKYQFGGNGGYLLGKRITFELFPEKTINQESAYC